MCEEHRMMVQYNHVRFPNTSDGYICPVVVFLAKRKAKLLAFLACRSCWLKARHSTKSVHVTSRLTLCRAAKEQFPKASSFGKPKVQVCLFAKREHRAPHGRKHCSLWFLFFRHFFVERQRNGIHAGTARREAVRASVEVVV